MCSIYKTPDWHLAPPQFNECDDGDDGDGDDGDDDDGDRDGDDDDDDDGDGDGGGDGDGDDDDDDDDGGDDDNDDDDDDVLWFFVCLLESHLEPRLAGLELMFNELLSLATIVNK